ncbi:hypothetical protein RTCIAT899_PB02730 (plasmid) [Rhizobium tropici CIAT 899]|nr:hypothetical protein RTCIAT899_PB02730 [Rhizobium tropici CIAT 899]
MRLGAELNLDHIGEIRRPTASSPERSKGISLQITIVREIERDDLLRMDKEVLMSFYARHRNENDARTVIHLASRQPISVLIFAVLTRW